MGVNSKHKVQSAKAMSLAFALLDFEHAGIQRRVKCARRSVDMQELREVSGTRSIYSKEARACNFIFNALRNGNPVQLFQERCQVRGDDEVP